MLAKRNETELNPRTNEQADTQTDSGTDRQTEKFDVVTESTRCTGGRFAIGDRQMQPTLCSDLLVMGLHGALYVAGK